MVAQRQDLVAALIACADAPFRASARRFVSGLSAEELRFIADYLGACILESFGCHCSRHELAQRIAEFQRMRQSIGDRDHQSILLLEFLCRTGVQQPAAGVH
jgi:hypothetical protein